MSVNTRRGHKRKVATVQPTMKIPDDVFHQNKAIICSTTPSTLYHRIDWETNGIVKSVVVPLDQHNDVNLQHSVSTDKNLNTEYSAVHNVNNNMSIDIKFPKEESIIINETSINNATKFITEPMHMGGKIFTPYSQINDSKCFKTHQPVTTETPQKMVNTSLQPSSSLHNFTANQREDKSTKNKDIAVKPNIANPLSLISSTVPHNMKIRGGFTLSPKIHQQLLQETTLGRTAIIYSECNATSFAFSKVNGKLQATIYDGSERRKNIATTIKDNILQSTAQGHKFDTSNQNAYTDPSNLKQELDLEQMQKALPVIESSYSIKPEPFNFSSNELVIPCKEVYPSVSHSEHNKGYKCMKYKDCTDVHTNSPSIDVDLKHENKTEILLNELMCNEKKSKNDVNDGNKLNIKLKFKDGKFTKYNDKIHNNNEDLILSNDCKNLTYTSSHKDVENKNASTKAQHKIETTVKLLRKEKGTSECHIDSNQVVDASEFATKGGSVALESQSKFIMVKTNAGTFILPTDNKHKAMVLKGEKNTALKNESQTNKRISTGMQLLNKNVSTCNFESYTDCSGANYSDTVNPVKQPHFKSPDDFIGKSPEFPDVNNAKSVKNSKTNVHTEKIKQLKEKIRLQQKAAECAKKMVVNCKNTLQILDND